MRHLSAALIVVALLIPCQAFAQQAFTSPSLSSASAASPDLSAAGQQVPADVAETARRFHIGFRGGVGLHPVLIELGGHVTLGPFLNDKLTFRPGIGLGFGEVTTTLGFNLDGLYTLTNVSQPERWQMYAGAGANFALSHKGFQADVPVEGTDTTDRFDFSDTDFQNGLNIIFGARHGGLFVEMNATAWGAHNVRLLVGHNF
jgi:hypothetical protein